MNQGEVQEEERRVVKINMLSTPSKTRRSMETRFKTSIKSQTQNRMKEYNIDVLWCDKHVRILDCDYLS